MNCCRLCSNLSSDAVSIFGEEGVNLKLAYKINKCLPLSVSLSDKLPRHVCRECIDHLDSTSLFITKCLHTQFLFEKQFKGREDVPSDEVRVLWSNINVDLTDVPSAIPQDGCANQDGVVERDLSVEDDSQAYNSPVSSPAASEDIEITNLNGGAEPLSASQTQSKDPSGSAFQERNRINSREDPLKRTKACVSSENDVSGNKENSVVSEQGRERMPQLDLYRMHRKHSCKYCGSSFLWRAELFYHQTTSHPDSVFRCRYCLKVFYDSNEEYQKHVAAHRGQMPLTKEKLARTELNLLKGNASLAAKYKMIVKEALSKKKQEVRPVETDDERRARESRNMDIEKSLQELKERKSVFVDVLKHLIERKSGGVIEDENGNQSRAYKCVCCRKDYQTKLDYHVHLRFNHKLRLPCRFCPRTFLDRKNFLLHEASHKSKVLKKHRCRKCSIDFDSEKEWKDHKKFHLQEKPHICKMCGEKFEDYARFRQHILVHREEKTCLCDKCGKAFRFQTSLRMHVKTCGLDPEVAKKNVCRYCGKRYLIPSRLRIHERVHTGEKPCMCSLCGKTFHSNERLRNHSHSHVVENVPCPVCGFVLKHRKHLKNHLKSHERVQCKTCGLWFDGPRKLACHQRVHKKTHVVKEDGGTVEVCIRNAEEESSNEPQMMMRLPVVIELENPASQVEEVQQGIQNPKAFQPLDKPYACPHCPLKFVFHQSYLKHMKVHSNCKPLYCPDCGGKSQSMDDLVRHYYTHFVGSRFYCDICGESFDRKITLIEHKRSHGSKLGSVGDTLLRKRLLMLQPRESLTDHSNVIPSNTERDINQISIQQMENQVIIGNPDCDGGEYLTFESHSVDSHCSEVIVVSTPKNMA